jgi:hypothetical protein
MFWIMMASSSDPFLENLRVLDEGAVNQIIHQFKFIPRDENGGLYV